MLLCWLVTTLQDKYVIGSGPAADLKVQGPNGTARMSFYPACFLMKNVSLTVCVCVISDTFKGGIDIFYAPVAAVCPQ